MKIVKATVLVLFLLSLNACQRTKHKSSEHKSLEKNARTSLDQKNPIEGVWQLKYATYAEPEQTWTVTPDKWKEIKVFTKTHFFWVGQELDRPNTSKDLTLSDMYKDAEPFIAGAGTYELNGDKYIEHAEYNIYPNFENQTMTFTYKVEGDTLTIDGTVPLSDIGMDYSGNEIIHEEFIRIE